MIDTMVFLLVFFMIASLAMSTQKGLPVALPGAESAPKATWADRSIVITETEQGEIYLNKTPLARDELSSHLYARLKEKPKLVVVINADESIRHREVVWLMDVARKAGAVHMAIATDGDQGIGEVIEP
ncbi:MAG: biopolymer transporter ExbD [Armatimonadetes bacterium]|nr:biopolymer transporter ExbD [Armatimonadota bacterium]NIM23169.1 biopolymer transporter ExbD [Armatimonadota bacterium]NIM67037.1 biopolymer transporter ExbD [Armatimonadota bacterium]NIM75571.1 biopolymer transporter ExbD [Armatimonadota bacterium]NIN05226.1 biopolymer transporter ExbD [Armatimonadota bacterium]